MLKPSKLESFRLLKDSNLEGFRVLFFSDNFLTNFFILFAPPPLTEGTIPFQHAYNLAHSNSVQL